MTVQATLLEDRPFEEVTFELSFEAWQEITMQIPWERAL